MRVNSFKNKQVGYDLAVFFLAVMLRNTYQKHASIWASSRDTAEKKSAPRKVAVPEPTACFSAAIIYWPTRKDVILPKDQKHKLYGKSKLLSRVLLFLRSAVLFSLWWQLFQLWSKNTLFQCDEAIFCCPCRVDVHRGSGKLLDLYFTARATISHIAVKYSATFYCRGNTARVKNASTSPLMVTLSLFSVNSLRYCTSRRKLVVPLPLVGTENVRHRRLRCLCSPRSRGSLPRPSSS